MIRDPKVFLLDEPLSNLDARLRIRMRRDIKALHEAIGSTIVYVTHDQAEAMTLSTRIAVFSEGRLQQFATPEEIYDRPANLFVANFVGERETNSAAQGVLRGRRRRAAASHGHGMLTLALVGASTDLAPLAGRQVVLGLRAEAFRRIAMPAQGDAAAVVAGRARRSRPSSARPAAGGRSRSCAAAPSPASASRRANASASPSGRPAFTVRSANRTLALPRGTDMSTIAFEQEEYDVVVIGAGAPASRPPWRRRATAPAPHGRCRSDDRRRTDLAASRSTAACRAAGEWVVGGVMPRALRRMRPARRLHRRRSTTIARCTSSPSIRRS